MFKLSTRTVGILLFLFLLVSCVLAGRDFYKILSVKKDATERQIKKAYLQLSKQYHPDKNPDDPEAQKKFVEIAAAYEVLSDKEKRSTYDRFGEDGLKQQGMQQQQRDPFDLFSQFGGFGDMFGRRHQHQEEQRGEDITIELQATLEHLYNGRLMEVQVQNQHVCHQCHGSGAKHEDDVKTCPVCKGRGVKITVQQLGPGFVQQMQSTCDRCHGKGKIASSVCPVCKGHKVLSGSKTLDVHIEPGMNDGELITFENAGDESPDRQPGHVIFKVSAVPHAVFTRQGANLHTTLSITLVESLVGFSKSVKQLDGRSIDLTRKQVTPHGYVMVVSGEGMPDRSRARRGDLHVKFEVVFPKSLTQEQKKGLAALL